MDSDFTTSPELCKKIAEQVRLAPIGGSLDGRLLPTTTTTRISHSASMALNVVQPRLLFIQIDALMVGPVS